MSHTGSLGTYTVGDTLAVQYDGSNINFIHNGVVKHRAPAPAANMKLSFDSSFNSSGASIKDVRFFPATGVDWGTITGAGKPQDGATAGASFGDAALGISPNINGIIDSSKISTWFRAGAVTNLFIGNYIASEDFNGTVNDSGTISLFGTTGWILSKKGQLVANAGAFRGVLQSTNYAQGTAGWQLNSNGSGELNNLTVRSSILGGSMTEFNWPVSGSPSYKGFYLGPDGFRIGSNIGKYISFRASTGALEINGDLAVNSVTTPMIISKACTSLEVISYTHPDNTWQYPTFTMDHYGTVSIVALVSYNFSYPGNEPSSFDFRVQIDGLYLSTVNGSSGVTAEGAATLVLSNPAVNAGTRTIQVFADHSHPSAGHEVRLLVFRSYR